MNPMTNMKNVLKLSEQELRTANKTSWHDQYRHSAWLFVGGLPYDLTEGDIICVFSQYGEVVNINLVRDKGTGKSKGFCFICYEDQRSTNLAVDNFNGIKLLSRTIRVDHCEDYKAPKDDKMDQETQQLHSEGCAPGSRFGNAPVLPSSAGTTGGLNKGLELPPMGSLLKIKTEKETPSKRSQEDEDRLVKKATEYKNKFTKQSEKRHRDTSTSSSQSDSALESEPNRTFQRKSPKKTRRKDKFSSSCEEGARVQKSKVQKMEAERERIVNDEERERIVNDEKRERIVNDEKRDNTEPRRERIGHESKYGGKKKVLDERERDISPRRNQSKKGKGATQIKDEIRKLFKRRN